MSLSKFLWQDAIFQKIEVLCPTVASVRDISKIKQTIPILINESVISFNYTQHSLKLVLGLAQNSQEMDEGTMVLIRIVDGTFLTRLKKTPKWTHRLRNSQSSITARVNSKVQSLGTVTIRLFFAIPKRSSKRKVPVKRSNGCKYHERSSTEQSRI
jgi:hypothetical protein